MKPMLKAELELEKHISKLEGQLASARYALELLRSGNADAPSHRNPRRIQGNDSVLVVTDSKAIPLFS